MTYLVSTVRVFTARLEHIFPKCEYISEAHDKLDLQLHWMLERALRWIHGQRNRSRSVQHSLRQFLHLKAFILEHEVNGKPEVERHLQPG